jgi:hypothetical protein
MRLAGKTLNPGAKACIECCVPDHDMKPTIILLMEFLIVPPLIQTVLGSL